jgi:hypothetical protein
MRYPVIKCVGCEGSGLAYFRQNFDGDIVDEEYCLECLGTGEIDLEEDFIKDIEPLALKLALIELRDLEKEINCFQLDRSQADLVFSHYKEMFHVRKQEIINEISQLRESQEGWDKIDLLLHWNEQVYLEDRFAPISNSVIIPAEMQVYDDWIFDEIPF